MTPAMVLSSTLAPLLYTYCARNADGASRNAIDSVGHASMPKIARRKKRRAATLCTDDDAEATPRGQRQREHEQQQHVVVV